MSDLGNKESKLKMEVNCCRVSRDYGHSAEIEVIFDEDVSAHKIINLGPNILLRSRNQTTFRSCTSICFYRW